MLSLDALYITVIDGSLKTIPAVMEVNTTAWKTGLFKLFMKVATKKNYA